MLIQHWNYEKYHTIELKKVLGEFNNAWLNDDLRLRFDCIVILCISDISIISCYNFYVTAITSNGYLINFIYPDIMKVGEVYKISYKLLRCLNYLNVKCVEVKIDTIHFSKNITRSYKILTLNDE